MTGGASATRMYIGGYTGSSGGRGAGIAVYDRSSSDGPWHLVQTVEADDPTFLALTEGALHAVSETTEGRVLSYTIGVGGLTPASVAASGGTAPCHVMRDASTGALVVANYTAGTVGVLSTDPSDPARVTRVLALPVGHGPVLDRQEHPHAHNTVPTPWGTLLVSDLGTDRVYEVRVDPVTLDPSIIATHALPSGSGPRHFAWLDVAVDGDGAAATAVGGSPRLLVTGELDGRLHVLLRTERGALVVDHSLPAFSVGSASPSDSASSTDEALLSHIEVVRLAGGGSVVYVAVRGRDSITVLAAGADGRLAVQAEVAAGGHWPRHFAVEGGLLYVANQLSDTVSLLPIDASTGVPGAPVAQLAVGSPSCVLFA
jgi:6-phosphogluconolactonase